LLDAINEHRQLKYYERNKFITLLDDDINNATRVMYFDLLLISEN
jgi:hypothetical protein